MRAGLLVGGAGDSGTGACRWCFELSPLFSDCRALEFLGLVPVQCCLELSPGPMVDMAVYRGVVKSENLKAASLLMGRAMSPFG